MTESETSTPTVGESAAKVAIVLVNWNGREDTLECLESLTRLDYPDFHVVLCDNASTDGSIAAVEAWCQGAAEVSPQSDHFRPLFETSPILHDRSAYRRIKSGGVPVVDELPPAWLYLVDTGSNLGFAGGNNVGIDLALKRLDADFVWLLNTDTIIEPTSLAALVSRARARPDAGMVGSTLAYYWNPDRVQAMGGASMDRWTTRTRHLGIGAPRAEVPADPSVIEAGMAYVVGASMLVSAEFIKAVGPMCEDYFLYYEEVDWALRGRPRFTLAYAPTSIVYHKVGGSSQKINSGFSLRFLYRNRVRFASRFFPALLPFALFSMVLDLVRATLRGRRNVAGPILDALLSTPQIIFSERRGRWTSRAKES